MKYAKYLELSCRVTGSKDILIIRPELLKEFMEEFLADDEIKDATKAQVSLSLSCGLRVGELKLIRFEDFSVKDGLLFVRINVLKKKRPERRWARIHPMAQGWLLSYIKDKVGFVVKVSQAGALKRVKALFGSEYCNHSARHALLSRLIIVEKMSTAVAAKLMHMSEGVVERYLHVREQETLAGIF